MYNKYYRKKVFSKLHKNSCAHEWLKGLTSLVKTNLIIDFQDVVLLAFNWEFQEKTMEFVWESQEHFYFSEQNLYKLTNKFCFNFFASIKVL